MPHSSKNLNFVRNNYQITTTLVLPYYQFDSHFTIDFYCIKQYKISLNVPHINDSTLWVKYPPEGRNQPPSSFHSFLVSPTPLFPNGERYFILLGTATKCSLDTNKAISILEMMMRLAWDEKQRRESIKIKDRYLWWKSQFASNLLTVWRLFTGRLTTPSWVLYIKSRRIK